MTVYLLKITPPLAHARHYLGFCEELNVEKRFARHLAGRGAKLIAAAVAAGRTVTLVHVWPGKDRNWERSVKNRGAAGKWCPCCPGKKHGRFPA